MDTTITDTPFGWPVVLYMTIAGIAAGTALWSSLGLLGGAPRWRDLGRQGLWLAAGAISLGSVFLIADLEIPSRFGLILTKFNPASVVSWGARIITLFGLFTAFSAWSLGRDRSRRDELSSGTRFCLWIVGLLAVAVGLYPALVLFQSGARPLWGNLMIAPLFFASALHVGLAALEWLRPAQAQGFGGALAGGADRRSGRGVELGLIGAQGILLIIFLLLARSTHPVAVARLVTGDLAFWLWAGVVLLGLLVPLAFLLATPYSRGRALVSASAVLLAGLSLRALVLFGGQGLASSFSSIP